MSYNPTKLKKILKDRIKREGPITFREFMRNCLYHDESGYYSRQDLAIGKGGDFVTAPHASRFFGSLIAVQLTECFKRIGEDSFGICEFGAGAGFLAQDILDFFKRFAPEYYESLTYFVVEPLERRRPALKEKLSEFSDHVKIIRRFSECDNFSGVILANELLDAFPIHLVQKQEGIFHEVYVDLDENGNLCEVLKQPGSRQLIDYLRDIDKEIPDDYRTEINLAMGDWMKEMARSMIRGYALIIDYGFPEKEYYAPHRNRGTLLGYSRQRTTEDFFSFPGMVDITAHVNFSDLRKYADALGMKCEGFTPQWAFLGGLDPDETLNKVFGKIDPFSPVLAGIKTLIFPQGMGETHKVFMLSKGVEEMSLLKGFSIRNYVNLL